jgi:hypothetical protein
MDYVQHLNGRHDACIAAFLISSAASIIDNFTQVCLDLLQINFLATRAIQTFFLLLFLPAVQDIAQTQKSLHSLGPSAVSGVRPVLLCALSYLHT